MTILIERDATFAHPTPQSHKGSIFTDSEEEKDNNSILESTVDKYHFLPSQPMPLPVVPSEILSPLTDISGDNTASLPEVFQYLDEDLPESATTDQPGS